MVFGNEKCAFVVNKNAESSGNSVSLAPSKYMQKRGFQWYFEIKNVHFCQQKRGF